MENLDLVKALVEFSFIKDNGTRLTVIKNHMFRDATTIYELKRLIDRTENEEERLNYIDHLELLVEYQEIGDYALDYFVSYIQIEISFAEFGHGFNDFEKRKIYLLSKPFLMEPKSIKCINRLIERKKDYTDSVTTTMRFYRNLLKACRVLGIEQAFKEFEVPEEKYVNVVNYLLKADSIYELITGINTDIISSENIRNVFHYLQAQFEKNQSIRDSILSLWDFISGFQTNKSNIWFWEE